MQPSSPVRRVDTPALRILAGLVLGLVVGTAIAGSRAAEPALAVAGPVGRLWLDALTMTVVPLVFSLLVTGILGAAEEARHDRTALRALGWFAVLLVGACLVSAGWTTLLRWAWPLSQAAGGLSASGGAPPPPVAAGGDWVSGIVPTNPLKAASETAMVPLVVFALFFGFAAARIAAPLGVFALALGLGARTGIGAVGVLGHYVVVVAGACLVVTLLAYGVAVGVGRVSVARFARAALPVQIVALSTQSSLATLPAMVAAAPKLGVDAARAGIVLPLAVSIFRAASAAANVAVALYLAQLHGVAVGPGALLLASLVAAAVSLAAVGLPAQVSFFATIGPVCLVLGVPIELLPLLLAVETIPDLFRTVGNVTADLAVARLAGRSAGAGDDAGD